MKWLRYIICTLLAVVCIALVLGAHYYYKGFYKTKSIDFNFPGYPDEAELSRINLKAIELKEFLSGKAFSNTFIFLVDMKLPSGRNRFFVYDLSKDSIIKTSLVAHGSGNSGFSISPVFSNEKESSCTALGKYRVGKSYAGRFGMAYKLYGLDSANSNAFDRNIVLHSYNCVPDRETYPYPICNSRGCPMVSPAFLKQLQSIIATSRQPIVLWIFD